MHGKLMFVAGAAIGYVFGTRQGRAAYDRLAKQVRGVWEDPRVQKGVSQAQKFAKDNVPVVGEMASDAVDKLKPAPSAGQSATSASPSSSPSASPSSTTPPPTSQPS